MSLRRVRDRHRQPFPRSRWVERPLVMPRTEKTEDFTAEAAGEEPVYFIQTPDQRRGDFAERFAPDVTLEVNARPTARVPDRIRSHIETELIGDEAGERQIERLG